MKTAYIVCGPPASGKGTLSRRISQELDIPVVSMSSIILANMSQIPWYQEQMEKGVLLDDEYCIRFWKEHMDVLGGSSQFVLDGFPRTGLQLSSLQDRLNYRRWRHDAHFIFLKIEKPVCKKRALLRAVEEGRKDDTNEVFEDRWYNWAIHGLRVEAHIKYRLCLKGNVSFHDVDANYSPDEIFYQVKGRIPSLLARKRLA